MSGIKFVFSGAIKRIINGAIPEHVFYDIKLDSPIEEGIETILVFGGDFSEEQREQIESAKTVSGECEISRVSDTQFTSRVISLKGIGLTNG